MRKPFANSAFTLIEMLIYMGLLSALLVVMTSLFVTFLQVRLESVSNSAIQQDGDFILSRLFYDISRADDILIPATNGASLNTLQLKVGVEDYTYVQNDGQLYITNNNGTDRLNSEGATISNLLFRRIGNNGRISIQLSFTETSTTKQSKGFDSKNFSTTVSLRK